MLTSFNILQFLQILRKSTVYKQMQKWFFAIFKVKYRPHASYDFRETFLRVILAFCELEQYFAALYGWFKWFAWRRPNVERPLVTELVLHIGRLSGPLVCFSVFSGHWGEHYNKIVNGERPCLKAFRINCPFECENVGIKFVGIAGKMSRSHI